VLKQRVDREIAAEQALALARNEYNQRLTLLESSRQQLEVTLEAAKRNKMDFFEVRQLSLYRSHLDAKIRAQEKDVQKAGFIVENKRDGVVQARQERQAIEKLKEQHLQDYKREMAGREQKEIDELSLNAYQRRIKQLHP
jgi:flagellar FliJ protein